ARPYFAAHERDCYRQVDAAGLGDAAVTAGREGERTLAVMPSARTSKPISVLGERKLVAIVYADMVGYSRLIGLDDTGTLRRLRTLRHALIDPAIDEHGGTLVQTGGDSLLIAFDSINGAVRFAVKVQQQVPSYDREEPPERRMRFRIGVNI